MVEIPDDVAKKSAYVLRSEAVRTGSPELARWADILWPQPPTLREQVAKAWCADYYGEYSRSAKDPVQEHLDAADAVLAVVADAPIEQLIVLVGPRFADWLAAQPLAARELSDFRREQRDHDVRLIRGSES